MIHPYYLIRSDIILNKNFIGGMDATNLSIVVVASKAYSGSNYYFLLQDDSLTFTATEPYVLTSVTHSVHDPDGKFSAVDGACSIIYMIKKFVPNPMAAVPAPQPEASDTPPPIKKKVNK